MKRRLTSSIIITLIIALISYYILLPPLNIRSPETWTYVIILLAIFVAINKFWLVSYKKKSNAINGMMFAVVALFVIFIVGNIFSSSFFNSKTFANQITLEHAEFEKEFVEEKNISNIALMDTKSAIIIGNRTLGTLSDLVSQFKVSPHYTQINYKGRPMKIAPLQYSDFIKYVKNDGLPGYVLVDPVKNTAEFVRLEKKIIYSDSAYFGKNLDRKLRLNYPTLIFDEKHLEIDEDGNPFWICSVVKPNAFVFGARNVDSVVVMDAVTGESIYYSISDAPVWIDYIYTGDKISELYNWYGLYQNGFWNSILGQEGCTATTDDFGYKAIGDDVYVFTGVTSLTAGDESNVGFIMVNSRTGVFKYYNIAGAEEYSAMSAAEGEVQQFDYKASFPSVINVSGQPTYIMVLKDNNSIVKLYALVNMENYNIVATGASQEESLTKYKKLLVNNAPKGTIVEADILTANIIIADINFVVVDGKTICYIKDENKNHYRIPFDESLVLLEVGSEATVEYIEHETITDLISIK